MYLLIIFLILLLSVCRNIEYFKLFESNTDILESNNYNMFNSKLNTNKYIKINEEMNFEDDKIKNTLDPEILTDVLNNLIDREIIIDKDLVVLTNDENDYKNLLNDIDNINSVISEQIIKYFNLFINENNDNNYNCTNSNNCLISIYDYYIYSIDKEEDFIYDLQYIINIEGSEYKYIYEFVIYRNNDYIIVKDIKYEGLTTELYDATNYNKKWSYYNDNNDIYKINNLDDIMNKSNIIETMDNNDKELYSCYGSEGTNKYDCEKEIDDLGQIKKPGKWDKLCVSDKECPFYKSNKNYKNNFGGCVDGYCELPLNMESISPHYYKIDPYKQPYCHNYRNNGYASCYLQNNKKLYPNFITPDYAFKDDINIRNIYMNNNYNL